MAHENKSTAIGVVRRCSVKQMFLKISQNPQENICARVYFSTKSLFFKKETLAQMFSCECVKISKNTFPYRTYAKIKFLLQGYTNHLTLAKPILLLALKLL